MPDKLIGDVAAGWPGILAGLASGAGSIAIWLWRTKRNDTRQDEVADQFGEMIEIMRSLAQAQQARADEQSRRADDFAKERNDLQRQLGGLEADVRHYGERHKVLRELLDDEKQNVRSLAALCRHLLAQCPGRLDGLDVPKGAALALLEAEKVEG